MKSWHFLARMTQQNNWTNGLFIGEGFLSDINNLLSQNPDLTLFNLSTETQFEKLKSHFHSRFQHHLRQTIEPTFIAHSHFDFVFFSSDVIKETGIEVFKTWELKIKPKGFVFGLDAHSPEIKSLVEENRGPYYKIWTPDRLWYYQIEGITNGAKDCVRPEERR